MIAQGPLIVESTPAIELFPHSTHLLVAQEIAASTYIMIIILKFICMNTTRRKLHMPIVSMTGHSSTKNQQNIISLHPPHSKHFNLFNCIMQSKYVGL